MNVDALNSIIADWARADRDFQPGYVATAAVLAQRLENLHRRALEAIAGPFAWVESSPGAKGRAFVVGRRDNRDASVTLAALRETAAALKARGFRASVRTSYPTLLVRLPDDVDAVAAAVQPAYAAMLATFRAERAACAP